MYSDVGAGWRLPECLKKLDQVIIRKQLTSCFLWAFDLFSSSIQAACSLPTLCYNDVAVVLYNPWIALPHRVCNPVPLAKNMESPWVRTVFLCTKVTVSLRFSISAVKLLLNLIPVLFPFVEVHHLSSQASRLDRPYGWKGEGHVGMDRWLRIRNTVSLWRGTPSVHCCVMPRGNLV